MSFDPLSKQDRKGEVDAALAKRLLNELLGA